MVLNQLETDSLSVDFLCPTIKYYIEKHYKSKKTYQIDYAVIHIYQFDDQTQMELDEINQLGNVIIQELTLFISKYNHKKFLTFLWFPTRFLKTLDTSKSDIGICEINGACTWHLPDSPFVAIYRKEEALKVMFHELSHFYFLDRNIPIAIDNYFQEKYSIQTDCSLKETYSELVGVFKNLEVVSKRTNKDIEELFLIELAFSIYQCQKIFQFFGIDSPNHLNKIKSNTNLFTYYILKTAFLLMIESIRDEIEKMEHKDIPYKFQANEIENFKNVLESGLVKLFKCEKVDKIPGLEKSMRMTIVDLSR